MSTIAHECDLFLLSSHHPYFADRILSEFARQGKRNVHGWGIGYYINNKANVLRSAEPAYPSKGGAGSLSREFAIAMRATSSPVILGHLRFTSKGSTAVENNHPFSLHFLDYEWMLIHNGTSHVYEELVPEADRILTESNNDTARIFEFLRRQIIEYYQSSEKRSLIEACRFAYSNLLERDPNGSFNLILSNGFLSFAFIHWRPFYVLPRDKVTGNTAIISTLEDLTGESWLTFEHGRRKKAKILVFSGPSLVFNGDIPR